MKIKMTYTKDNKTIVDYLPVHPTYTCTYTANTNKEYYIDSGSNSLRLIRFNTVEHACRVVEDMLMFEANGEVIYDILARCKALGVEFKVIA